MKNMSSPALPLDLSIVMRNILKCIYSGGNAGPVLFPGPVKV